MEQVIFGGKYNILHDTNTEYNGLCGGANWLATEVLQRQVISTGGVIKNLRVKLNGSPGGGKHYDFTLMLNGNPTALTLEIAGAATSGSNTADEIAVVAGDTVSLESNPDSTPTARYATWTSMFEGSTANESLILASADDGQGSNAVIVYTHVMGVHITQVTIENQARQICPTSGAIENFYVELDADPGDPGQSDGYRFTLRLNGVTVAQSLIVTIIADNKTGNDTAHSLVVAAGDILTMMIEPLNAPSVLPHYNWGMTFVADINGESIMLGGSRGDLDDTATEYHTPYSNAQLPWIATEAERYMLGQTCILKKLYMLLNGSPGAGNNYTFTVRLEGASPGGGLVVEIADAATTGNDTSNEIAVSDSEVVNMMAVPTDTPTVSDAYWGLVSFIEVLGWSSGDISGVAIGTIAKINGVALADITKVNGVA